MGNDLHGLRFGVELCLRAAPAMDSKTKVSKSTTSRAVTGLLLLATAACVLIALLNLADRSDFQLPHDGVTWIDRPAGVESLRVELEGPGAQAGIHAGDRLVRIDSSTIDEALDVARTLARIGVWRQATYVIERAGTRFETRVIVGAAPEGGVASSFQWIVGLAYLAIGLTVLLSRVAGPMVHHFFLFTLVSFVLHCFSYTTRLDGLDRLVYWTDVWATLLAPSLFLHFCLTFPDAGKTSRRRRWASGALYLPVLGLGVVQHLVALGALEFTLPLVEVRFLLDRIAFGLYGVYFIVGALILRRQTGRTEEPILRQQRRWLAMGSLWGTLPFAVFYLAPYVAGQVPSPSQTLSVFSLGLIPLTFAYAIVRYRLMDVELFARRVTAASLAASGLLAAAYGLLFAWSGTILSAEGFGPAVWVVSVLGGALAFQPLRSWIQTRIDRRHYRDRYDSRRTLSGFAAALTTETDLDKTLDSVTDRLVKTLRLEKVAVFVPDLAKGPTGDRSFRLVKAVGLERVAEAANTRFLADHALASNDAGAHLHIEDAGQPPSALAPYRSALVDLDLNDYVPCRVKGRTIAYLGLGRTRDGQFLNSEDIALVRALSGYLAIAIENARLHESLDRKARQYERLKDYSENIVESLSVGISATDLDGRVGSWNTPLELMFGISRQQASGRRLNELLPARLVTELNKIHEDTGLKNLYKFRIRASDFPDEFRPDSGHDDQERVLNIVVAPLVTKTFERIGRLIIFDDVTEHSVLENQLIQAEKLSSIGLLAAGVAHEVNTPLAVISSYAQLLARQVSETPKTAEILDKITSQTFRASEIVNSLLNFSRTSGSEKTTLDLSRTINETLEMVAPQLRQGHISVEKNLLPEASGVLGNAGQLQQVFLNLILNARDAMPDGGRLIVSTIERGGMACVSIRDTGSGMTADQTRHVFDPFFTTKGPKRGTGLGLAVSYGIIQEHSGTITVDSRPGEGSTFIVEIPVAAKPIHA